MDPVLQPVRLPEGTAYFRGVIALLFRLLSGLRTLKATGFRRSRSDPGGHALKLGAFFGNFQGGSCEHGPTLSSLWSFVWTPFGRIVARYGGEERVRTLNWEQTRALALPN